MKQESLKAATDKAMIKLEVTVEHETLTLEDVERIVAKELMKKFPAVDVTMLRSRRGLVKEFIYNYYDKLQQDENRRQKEYLKLELRKMCREGNVSGLLDTLNVASRFEQETGLLQGEISEAKAYLEKMLMLEDEEELRRTPETPAASTMFPSEEGNRDARIRKVKQLLREADTEEALQMALDQAKETQQIKDACNLEIAEAQRKLRTITASRRPTSSRYPGCSASSAAQTRSEAPPGAIFRALLCGCDSANDNGRFETDVLALKEVLETMGYTDIVTCINATPRNVLQEVSLMAGRCQEDDLVLFYTTSHGGTDRGGLNLAYANTPGEPYRGRPARLKCDDLAGEIAGIRSSKVLCLVHSCYAAAFLSNIPVNSMNATNAATPISLNNPAKQAQDHQDAALAAFAAASGRVAIAAGARDRVTYGQVFPDAVCETLKRARDENNDLNWLVFSNEVNARAKEEALARLGEDQTVVLHATAQPFDLWLPGVRTAMEEDLHSKAGSVQLRLWCAGGRRDIANSITPLSTGHQNSRGSAKRNV